MDMYNFFITLQNISTIMLIFCIFYVMKQRPSPVQRDLLLFTISMLVTIMGYTLEMKATDMGSALTALKMSYIGRPITLFAMVSIISDLLGFKIRSSVRTVLGIIQVSFIFIVFTLEKHNLFYQSMEFVNDGLFPHLNKVRGPLYLAFFVVMIFYSVAMFVCCIIAAKKATCNNDRKLLFLFGLVIMCPLIGALLYLSNLTQGYNMFIFGLVISVFIITGIFRRYDVFDAVNIAWENVFKFINAGLLVCDKNGKIIYENEMAKEINISDRAEELCQTREYVFHEDKVFRLEKLPILSQDDNLGYAYYIDNETENYHYEERLKEERQRADEASVAKTQFLSSMSHDIRTPMNAILGLTDIARMHIDEKERVEDSLNKINTSGKHLIELINEVLDINKIESGKFDLIEEDFDLVELTKEVETMTKPLIEAKRHTFTLDTEEVKHSYIRGDKSRLSQVLTNLVSNSVKYTNNGGLITIKISETKCFEDKVVFKIIVRDNGIGMSEEFLPTLFDPFTRAKDEDVYKAQGTGLGMSITKQFVDLMGGTIDARSSLGIGTTFVIIIPFSLGDENTRKVNAKGIIDLSQIDLSAKKVLVVEDNEVNSEIMGEFLKMTRAEIEFAADGVEAVTMFNESVKSPYDIIFMDVEMPRMNGYEATKNIREIDSSYAKNVPIIAVTANAFAEDIKKSMNAGMTSYISKPIEYQKLCEVLWDFCN